MFVLPSGSGQHSGASWGQVRTGHNQGAKQERPHQLARTSQGTQSAGMPAQPLGTGFGCLLPMGQLHPNLAISFPCLQGILCLVASLCRATFVRRAPHSRQWVVLQCYIAQPQLLWAFVHQWTGAHPHRCLISRSLCHPAFQANE